MNKYTSLARTTVETFARTGKTLPLPTELPAKFYADQKGVFVTIHKREEGTRKLRGCIGTIAPTRDCVAAEIIQNAVWASQEDNRFSPVTAAELPDLDYEVSLLNEPECIHCAEDLDPRRFGVIVRADDGRSGLLLPDIEGVDSAPEQIEITARKAGIDIRTEEFSLWRFTVSKYAE
jgi:AmmeMemoRadiSam system protein A